MWCEVARPRATSRSSLRLARWQLQNVPAAPSPSAKRRLYPRQRGCSPLFSRRKISRVSRGMIDRRCISIVRFCIVVLLEISRCVESTNWVLLFFILLSLWTRLILLRYSGTMLVSKYVIYVIVFRLRTIVFYKTREYYYRQFVFPRVGKKYREEGKGKNM